MAGVSDLPFRIMCRKFGAGMTVSEMVASNSLLWGSEKTKLRSKHSEKSGIKSVQIMGADPKMLAMAAQFNVANGAQIIDINMGCPAKKVCNVAAGSALLKNEKLVAEILNAVVNSVSVPVSLKIRTGWDENNKNAVRIAKIAQDCGVLALAIHGRTRADAYRGKAEFDTIALVKQSVKIPIIANGDITDGTKALKVLQYTKADGIMIGRAAFGRPWIFKEISHFLTTGNLIPAPSHEKKAKILLEHLSYLYGFYGNERGVRIARKHIAWYSKGMPASSNFRRKVMAATNVSSQQQIIKDFFSIT